MVKPIVCIGAALVDEMYQCKQTPIQGTSNPSSYQRFAGGVARNVAHHLALLGHNVELITHFGRDSEGDWLREVCSKAGIGLSNSCISDSGTGRFAAILSPDGELFTAASVTALEEEITPAFLQSHSDFLASASLLVLDCNLSLESLRWLLDFARVYQLKVVIEPVSVSKASKLKTLNLEGVLLITPGEEELLALENDSEIQQRGILNIWLRKGKQGSTLILPNEEFSEPAPNVEVTDTTGAGDAALAGWIHALTRDKNPVECVRYGHALAALILQTKGAVLESLSLALLQASFENLYGYKK